MNIEDIVKDDEFEHALRKASDHERSELEQLVLMDGFREPLKVWDGILIDGYTRLDIWEKNPSLTPPDIEELHFPSREAAMKWVLSNQIGRRNLSGGEYQYIRGKLYDSGVSTGAPTRTAQRDREKATRIDEIVGNVGPEAKPALMAASRRAVKEIAELPPEEQKKAVTKPPGPTKHEKSVLQLIADCEDVVRDKLMGAVSRAEKAHGGPSAHSQAVVRCANAVLTAIKVWREDVK